MTVALFFAISFCIFPIWFPQADLDEIETETKIFQDLIEDTDQVPWCCSILMVGDVLEYWLMKFFHPVWKRRLYI